MNDSVLGMVALADELEAFIMESIPKSDTVKKYGGTLFTLKPNEKEGQFCGVFIYKQHVQLSFSKGAELTDTKGLLTGSGKLRRHVNLQSLEQVNLKELKKLLRQAATI